MHLTTRVYGRTSVLEGHEEKLKSIDTNMHGIKCDLLLIDDYKCLAERATGLEEILFELHVWCMSSHQSPAKEQQDRVYIKYRDGIEQSKAG